MFLECEGVKSRTRLWYCEEGTARFRLSVLPEWTAFRISLLLLSFSSIFTGLTASSFMIPVGS